MWFQEAQDDEFCTLGWQPYFVKVLKRLLINQTNWMSYNLLFESIGHPVDRYNMYYDNGENELSPGSKFFQEFDLPSHRLLVALHKLNE